MDYCKEIEKLKKEKNAVVLAHFYQPPEVQDAADFVGDSLELARKAKAADCETIVFCGVFFMAESAKILSPERRVLLPEKGAGCPMADMIKPEDITALRAKHPDAAVVIYVNSTAACKAVSDICCTSTNAVKIVRSLKNKEIIFVPDRNLGHWVAEQCPDKEFFYFDGCCPIHDSLRLSDALAAKKRWPDAPLAAHPECRPEVLAQADFIGSTAQIIKYAAACPGKELIIGTESGILHKLEKECPGKLLRPIREDFICPDMKKTDMKKLYECMLTGEYEVRLDAATIAAADGCLERMLAVK